MFLQANAPIFRENDAIDGSFGIRAGAFVSVAANLGVKNPAVMKKRIDFMV